MNLIADGIMLMRVNIFCGNLMQKAKKLSDPSLALMQTMTSLYLLN